MVSGQWSVSRHWSCVCVTVCQTKSADGGKEVLTERKLQNRNLWELGTKNEIATCLQI